MRPIRMMCASVLTALTLGLTAWAATPDPTPGVCPFGGSAATQPSAQASAAAAAAAGCPVASSASTQPTATLNLHVVQGTGGGPAIGAETVTLALFSNGQLIDQAKAKLTADGTLEVKGLPVSAIVQPVVTLEHAGATYTAVGDPLDAQHVQQNLELKVYETTTDAPQWKVSMRHIITQPSKDGVDVTDMLSIHNPADHAWIGKQTVTLALPPGAIGVKIGGDINDGGAAVVDGKLIVHQALVPGDSRYEIQYTIPADKGAANLLVIAPTDVQHILVFVPNDGTTLTTTGLQALDPKALGDMGTKTRAFMATSLIAGQKVSIKFENLGSASAAAPVSDDMQDTAAPVDAAVATPVDTNAYTVKVLAVAGSMVILVGGGSVLLFKAPRRAK